MRWLVLKVTALALVVGTLGACAPAYVYPAGPYRPYAGCVWVRGHYRAYGVWVPGHWRC